jgi:hypothetical protein
LLGVRDLEALGWLGEQYGGRLDHLEVLLGCGERSVQRVVARLRAHRLVRVERVLYTERPWATPTAFGLQVANLRFKPWTPGLRLLSHIAAVNDVRLHIQQRAPECEWVSERTLAFEQAGGDRGHLPDGVVITDDRQVAIEVELTLKSEQRIRAILDDLTSRFHTVVYFAEAKPYRRLNEIAVDGLWPTVEIRKLPTFTRSVA